MAFLQQERGRNFSSARQWHQQCAPPTGQPRPEEGSRFPWRSIPGKPGGVSRRTLPAAASPSAPRSPEPSGPWRLSSRSLRNHRWRQRGIPRGEVDPENPRRPGRRYTGHGAWAALWVGAALSHSGGHVLALKLFHVSHLHYSISLAYTMPHAVLRPTMSPTAWALLAFLWQKNGPAEGE